MGYSSEVLLSKDMFEIPHQVLDILVQECPIN
jgi:hypothetical protein